jgi:hypothetical protein
MCASSCLSCALSVIHSSSSSSLWLLTIIKLAIGSQNNWWKNIRTRLPYLKDVLVPLHADVVVSMKNMSSSSSPSYI